MTNTTPAQLGLAIASLTIGVLTACAAVPAGISFHGIGETMVTLFAVLPFAVIAIVLGVVGRTNAMGIAGLALGFVALTETVAITTYYEYKDSKAKAAKLAEEEKLRQIESARVKQEELRTKANMEARIQAEAEAETASSQQREAEAARRAELEKERLKVERELALRNQQQEEAARQRAEDERKAAEARAAREAELDRRDAELIAKNQQDMRKKTASESLQILDEAKRDLASKKKTREEAEAIVAKTEAALRVYKIQATSAATKLNELRRKQYEPNSEQVDYSTQMERLQAEESRANEKIRELDDSFYRQRSEVSQAQRAEKAAEKKVKTCAENARALGADPNAIPAPALSMPADEPSTPTVTPKYATYTLKDGRKLSAKRVMVVDENYAIQEPDGTMITVPKKDVVEIKEP